MSHRTTPTTPSKQRTRSSSSSPLRSTPSSAAKTLGRTRSGSSTGRLLTTDESFEMSDMSFDETGYQPLVFDEPEPPVSTPPPAFDPMENLYQVVTIGEGGFSDSMEQDLEKLADLGFIIDGTEKGKLGFGFFGVVYKGVYGEGVKDIRDKEGKPLRNVEAGRFFATKYVNFRVDSAQAGLKATQAFGGGAPVHGQTQEKRETYEIEKYIMTICDHPNIVPIRMAINMGPPQVFTYRGSTDTFVQHDRVYLIMDFADLGSLMTFMNKNADKLTPMDRIKMVRDLFWGMKYLHDKGIIHGDVHTGNVLIFKEDGEMVSKWADFGLAEITPKKEFVYTSRGSNPYGPRFVKRAEIDCRKMGGVLWHIWRGRQRLSEPEELRNLCDQHMKLVDVTKVCHNLDEVLEQFREPLFYQERLV